MKKREIRLPISMSHLKFVTALLICGVVFAAAQTPFVRGFFGGSTGGGAANSYVSNAGHQTRQPTNVAGENLKAYYPLDGNTNDQVLSSGVNNLSSSATAVSSAAGKYGNGLSIDTTNAKYLAASSNSKFEYGGDSTSFTFALWIKPTSGSSFFPSFLSKYSDDSVAAGKREYLLYCVNNGCTSNLEWALYVSDASAGVASKALGTLGVWHFVVVDYNITNRQLSIDIDNSGTLGTATLSGPLASSPNATFELGNYFYTGTFPCRCTMDSVGAWTRILSQSERDLLYNGGAGRNYSGLPAQLKTNLTSWWDLDESGSNTRVDSVKQGNNGTAAGNAAPTNGGKFGQAYTFDGTGDYISTTYTGVSGSNPRSISMWVNGTSGYLAGYGTDTTRSRVDLQIESNTTFWVKTSLDTRSWTNAVTPNVWNHIVVTYPSGGDVGDFSLYVNGVVKTPSTTSGTLPLTTGSALPLKIGIDSTATAAAFSGKIDDFRFYDKELTSSEVAVLYGGSESFNCDQSCKGWWKLDETSGTLEDAAGANDGTATNATASEGIYKNGYSFDGTGDYLGLTNDSLGSIGSAASTARLFTISGWIYPTAGGAAGVGTTRAIYSFIRTDQLGGLIFAIGGFGTSDGRQLRIFAGDQNSTRHPTANSGSGLVTLNEWQHVAVTWESDANDYGSQPTAKFYINGKLVNTMGADCNYIDTVCNEPINYTAASGPYIGTYDSGASGDNMFAGKIDDLRIQTRVLTASQIYEQYLAGRP